MLSSALARLTCTSYERESVRQLRLAACGLRLSQARPPAVQSKGPLRAGPWPTRVVDRRGACVSLQSNIRHHNRRLHLSHAVLLSSLLSVTHFKLAPSLLSTGFKSTLCSPLSTQACSRLLVRTTFRHDVNQQLKCSRYDTQFTNSIYLVVEAARGSTASPLRSSAAKARPGSTKREAQQ